MILSDGKNQYPNHVFRQSEWSAPYLQTYEEVLDKVKELQLAGRVIRNIHTVGMAYNWTDDGLGEAVFLRLEKKIEAGEIPKKNYPYLPEEAHLFCFAELDEPFLLEFEDGDVLCMDFSGESLVRMDLNTVPTDIRWGVNPKTIHPQELFKALLGKEITAVEIKVTTDNRRRGQDVWVREITLVCRGDRYEDCKKLAFYVTMGDYGVVELRDGSDVVEEIPAPEVRAVVQGFIPEEVLNNEEEFLFGEK